MKIRTDFVTNSSSTSFVIITTGDFSRQEFLELMGINHKSPLEPLFTALYESFRESMYPANEFFSRYERDAAHIDWFEMVKNQFVPEVVSRIAEARNTNKNIYIGKLSSDESLIESFFCTDSFEAENDKIYLNALDNIW